MSDGFKLKAQHKKAEKIAAHIFDNILTTDQRRSLNTLAWVKGWSPEYRAEMATEAGQHLASDDSWDLVVSMVTVLIDGARERAAQSSRTRAVGASRRQSVPASVR